MSEIAKITGVRYQHARSTLIEQRRVGKGSVPPETPIRGGTVDQDRVDSVVAFADLVARVEAGDEIAVTREGTPVARIVPFAPSQDADAIRAALAGMDAIRWRTSSAGLRTKGLIDEGRP